MSPIPSLLRWPFACFCVGMRSLSPNNERTFRTRTIAAISFFAAGMWTFGCGAGSASPPPPPSSIEVTLRPATGSVLLGDRATFTASVTNAPDTGVSWSVDGVPGGNAALGTIASTDVYTAPADLPSPATVQVTATSHADPTKSGTGNLAIASDITLNLTPNPAAVELGATQAFQATVTSSAHPDTAIRWSLSGPARCNCPLLPACQPEGRQQLSRQ